MSRYRLPMIGVGLVVALLAGVVGVAIWTQPTRESLRVFTEIVGAANREDIEAARRLCSARYAKTHLLRPAGEGGLEGLPRNIHKNFQVWRKGPNVWLCPTNRVGPVYQFVHESGSWRFDGPVGVLRGRGEFVRLEDSGIAEVETED